MKDLHGVSYECRLVQLVLLYEVAHVRCHGRVVMASVVRRVAMVAEVLVTSLTQPRPSSTEKKKENDNCISKAQEQVSCAIAYKSIYRPPQIPRQGSASMVSHLTSMPAPSALCGTGSYLLILRLFFFEPKSPCRNKIGDVRFGSSETALAGSWRS